MRAPDFWDRSGLLPLLLAPLAAAYGTVGRLRHLVASPWRAGVPVVCIGNLVAGGAGKTPTALAVGEFLAARGRAVHFLTRGYKGRAVGPLRVELRRHGVREVGDEALLLAARGPTWVARSRPDGARAAIGAAAELLVLDDGFQNPTIEKDISLLVVDGAYGFGNARVMPAGPLRESLRGGLNRASAVVLLGDDRAGVAARIGDRLPLLRARLEPAPEARSLAGREVVAFAGIGRPEKFFETLREIGCRLLAEHAFPDHHLYRDDEIERLFEEAATRKALAVTTEKDAVRLSAEARARVRVVKVMLAWEDEERLAEVLAPVLGG
jgi:tetraacyldisaccharide 4'-kinase